jgi:hypothetical protein
MSILSYDEIATIVCPKCGGLDSCDRRYNYCDDFKYLYTELLELQISKATKEIITFLDGANDLKDLDNRLQELKKKVL